MSEQWQARNLKGTARLPGILSERPFPSSGMDRTGPLVRTSEVLTFLATLNDQDQEHEMRKPCLELHRSRQP